MVKDFIDYMASYTEMDEQTVKPMIARNLKLNDKEFEEFAQRVEMGGEDFMKKLVTRMRTVRTHCASMDWDSV